MQADLTFFTNTTYSAMISELLPTGHIHTSAELLELLHQSFKKSDNLLQMLRKELGNG